MEKGEGDLKKREGGLGEKEGENGSGRDDSAHLTTLHESSFLSMVRIKSSCMW